jgi:hypothetical protein
VRKNGEIVYVKVISKNLYEIQYKLNGVGAVKKLSTANVKEIRYANGKVDLIDNNPEKKPKTWVTTPAKKDSAKKTSATTAVTETNEIPDTPDDTIGMDKIVRRNGDALFGKVIGKNIYEIQYKRKRDNVIRKVSTSNVKEIIYANGKVDLIDNNPEKKSKDWISVAAENDWAKIQVFSEASQVEGATEIGEIEAEYVAKKMDAQNDLLEKNIIITLKKKALTMKANAVLIIDKKFERNYGELPFITVKAVAYSK